MIIILFINNFLVDFILIVNIKIKVILNNINEFYFSSEYNINLILLNIETFNIIP